MFFAPANCPPILARHTFHKWVRVCQEGYEGELRDKTTTQKKVFEFICMFFICVPRSSLYCFYSVELSIITQEETNKFNNPTQVNMHHAHKHILLGNFM